MASQTPSVELQQRLSSSIDKAQFIRIVVLEFLRNLFRNPFISVGLSLLVLSIFSYAIAYVGHALLIVIALLLVATITYTINRKTKINSKSIIDKLSVNNLKNIVLLVSITPSVINALSLTFLAVYIAIEGGLFHVSLHSTIAISTVSFAVLKSNSFAKLRIQLIAVLHVCAAAIALYVASERTVRTPA